MVEQIPEDSFLRQLNLFGVREGRRIWRLGTGRDTKYYTWDSLHGEVEVFDARGYHLGAVTNKFIKDMKLGRRLRL